MGRGSLTLILSRIHQSATCRLTLRPPPTAALLGMRFPKFYSSLPPHHPVMLPALSPTMEMGTIISWEKKEGDKLNEGDLLAEIETDKATMGLETPEEGYLAKIVIAAGTRDVPIGKLVCIIVENASDAAAFKDYTGDGAGAPPPKAAAAPSAAAPAAAPAASAPPQAAAAHPPGSRLQVSPMARGLAARHGIDLSAVQGTGFGGSIQASDLASFKSASVTGGGGGKAAVGTVTATSAAYEDIKIESVRHVIAKRLLESKLTIPHYYLTTEVPMDAVIKLRSVFNEQLKGEGIKLSINDFVIKAAAAACLKVPECNSSWMGEVIRQYTSVDVSVAVSSPRGLITPIVFSADKKGLVEISQTVKVLAQKARDGKLTLAEFQGGTISVSNLGMFGIHQFCAIVNPPQACILALGATEDKLVSDGKDGFKNSQVMYATLSCDHRVIDGAVGARWLQVFKSYLSNPATIIL